MRYSRGFIERHLCETAIHKQLHSGDLAAVARREKHDGLCDFIGCSKPAERNKIGNHFPALLALLRGSQQVTQSKRVDQAWAHEHSPSATKTETDNGFQDRCILGEINDQQQATWRKTLSVFDEKLKLHLPSQPPPRLVARKESSEIEVQTVR
jgi:hypothetical protein